MKKRILISLALTAGVIFAYAMHASAITPPQPPPPPPPVTVDCSPGYYKNHMDVVIAECGSEFASLEPLLRAEWGAKRAERELAKGLIDACFDAAGYSPCDDD